MKAKFLMRSTVVGCGLVATGASLLDSECCGQESTNQSESVNAGNFSETWKF
jgi:hypothetical protein